MKNLTKKQPYEKLIVRTAFTSDNSKVFVLLAIVLFHVVPFILAIIGDLGREILTNLMMFYLNPMIVFGLMLAYGLIVGFNIKMPLITVFLSSVSIVMYYSLDPNLGTYAIAFLLALCVFSLMSFAGVLIGAFIKHFRVF